MPPWRWCTGQTKPNSEVAFRGCAFFPFQGEEQEEKEATQEAAETAPGAGKARGRKLGRQRRGQPGIRRGDRVSCV